MPLNFLPNSFFHRVKTKLADIESTGGSLTTRIESLENFQTEATNAANSLNGRVNTLESQMSNRTGRIAALETWRANKGSALAKLEAVPTLAGITLPLGLGLTISKDSIEAKLLAIHTKVNEAIDMFSAREMTA